MSQKSRAITITLLFVMFVAQQDNAGNGQHRRQEPFRNPLKALNLFEIENSPQSRN